MDHNQTLQFLKVMNDIARALSTIAAELAKKK